MRTVIPGTQSANVKVFSIVEMNVGIITACMSALPAFFSHSKAVGSTVISSLQSHLFRSSRSHGSPDLNATSSGYSKRSRKSKESGDDKARLTYAASAGRIYQNPYIELEDATTFTVDVGNVERGPPRTDLGILRTDGYGIDRT